MAEAEDHQLQVYPDLGRGQPGTVDGTHGLEHVVHQLRQFRRTELRDRLRLAQQARVAHFEDLACCH